MYTVNMSNAFFFTIVFTHFLSVFLFFFFNFFYFFDV